MGRRWRGALVGAAAAALLACACGSSGSGHAAAASSTFPRGPANSRYWIAGWLPPGARLQEASQWSKPARRSPASRIEYGRGESEPVVDISVFTDALTAQSVAECRTDGVVRVDRTMVRGHQACEGSNYDDGNPFGWNTQWTERPGVTVQVLVSGPESVPAAKVIARRVAAAVRPASTTTWKQLVLMTDRGFDPADTTDWLHARAATGSVSSAQWTLTAIIPRGFPLGRDDYRPTCVELAYEGQTRSTCSNDPGGAEFQRMHGQVFAFGVVPAGARDLSLENEDRGHGERGVVATLQSSAAAGTTWRFFAATLPTDNCGVVVYDVTDGRHKAVGSAVSVPSDGLPCHHPLPNGHVLPTTVPQ